MLCTVYRVFLGNIDTASKRRPILVIGEKLQIDSFVKQKDNFTLYTVTLYPKVFVNKSPRMLLQYM